MGTMTNTDKMEISTDTSQIKEWRSIVTLVVFAFTNVIVLFPFRMAIPIPRFVWDGISGALRKVRVIPPSSKHEFGTPHHGSFKRLNFPINLVTAPLFADLFLLAIQAIGRDEVYNGTVGAHSIDPIDVMAFFITLAYIAISIDASGLIRYLACKVLHVSENGRKLFFYLYVFFFSLTTFIGNDPIILSGTPFLAYITRVSNIEHPGAWIFMQFAIANIASAILVSSNPTNLVLTGAFNIKYINYTANIIVPVVVTVIFLFPFLLYVVFRDQSLIPSSIEIQKLDVTGQPPVNPNIPYAQSDSQGISEIINPFLDKGSAIFGSCVMAATLISVLALNASTGGHYPVYWITLPAAVVMFCWDMTLGWLNRQETRELARNGRQEFERAQAEQAVRERQDEANPTVAKEKAYRNQDAVPRSAHGESQPEGAEINPVSVPAWENGNEKKPDPLLEMQISQMLAIGRQQQPEPTTLVSIGRDVHMWARETFPTATTVFSLLPFPLVPFAFSMFVLVEALGTKGWIPVFAYGWHHWVNKTGIVGSIGGMSFISVVLCNFSGTNIGTSILLCRVIQTWQQINMNIGSEISDRVFWGTIYSMALAVNYGAFSSAFSASLAGFLWRDILAKKGINVGRFEFLRVNVPIITIAMCVGCAVLVGEIYIVRGDQPYNTT